MLTVADQQAASEHPLLHQGDVRLELMSADSPPVLALSLLLGGVPPTLPAGDKTNPS